MEKSDIMIECPVCESVMEWLQELGRYYCYACDDYYSEWEILNADFDND